MSEVVATINTTSGDPSKYKDWEYPQNYEALERIEIKKQKDGGEVAWGVIAIGGIERQFQMPDLAEVWGHDPGEIEEYKADPDKWEMKRQLRELTGRVEALEARNQELESQLKQKDTRIDDLEKRLEKLEGKGTAAVTKKVWIKGGSGRRTLKEGFDIKKPAAAASSVRTPDPAPKVTRIRPAADTRVGRRQAVQEETARYRRRPAAAVLGGLATAAAVVAAGMGIWNHHELEEQESHTPAAATIPNNGYATPTVLSAEGYHLNYYNQARGRKITGVWLPKDVNLVGSPGNYSLVKDGIVLVKKAQWDSQGKLKKSQRQALEKNYNIGWSFLKGDRKVSIIINR